MKNAIRVLNGFGRSLEVILPKLRDGYIVPDPTFARELALENPHAFFLSQSGECFHNVTVTGGKQRAEGPLSMKRELRDVLRLLGELEQASAPRRNACPYPGPRNQRPHFPAGSPRRGKTRGRETGHDIRPSVAAAGNRILAGERTPADFRQELQRLEAERTEKVTLRDQLQMQIAGAEQKRVELEHLAAAGQEQLSALRERRDLAAQSASQRLARVATLEERHRSATVGLERIESLLSEVIERVASLRVHIESSLAEKLQRESENREIAVRLVDFDAERNACETRDSLLQVESDQVRARLAEIDDALHQARQLLDQSRDRRAELSANAAKLQSDAQYMGETCLNELGVQRGELMADTTIAVVRDEQLTIEDQIYRDMRSRLDAMGPVNMMALEEYKETAERHAFLETQRKDLSTPSRTPRQRSKKSTRSRARSSKRPSTRSTRTSRPPSASSSAAATASCA